MRQKLSIHSFLSTHNLDVSTHGRRRVGKESWSDISEWPEYFESFEDEVVIDIQINHSCRSLIDNSSFLNIFQMLYNQIRFGVGKFHFFLKFFLIGVQCTVSTYELRFLF